MAKEMNSENNEIYFVTFEEYLKPKKPHKQRTLQIFNENSFKQKSKLQFQPNNLDLSNLRFKNSQKINKNLSKNTTQNIKKLKEKKFDFTKYFKPFNSRQDETTGICRRKTGFEIYCELASVHGFINFVNASIWQRIFWALIICTAACMCCFVGSMSHIINQGMPTIFYTEGITHPTWTVPIPALTICSLNRISKFEANKVANQFALNSSLSRNEILKLFPFAMYATHEVNGTARDFEMLDSILERNNYTISQLAYEIAPKCESDEYKLCKITGHFEHCKRVMAEVRTVEGICCSNNFLALKTTASHLEPMYSLSIGHETGLTILIEPKINNYTFSSHKFYGYKFFLHDAFDAIDGLSSKNYILTRTESLIGVTPSASYSTYYLRRVDVKSRRCYFDDERNLIIFRKYSQTNCLIECRSSLFYNKCGCVPTFWPRLNKEWRHCQRATEINCILNNKKIFSALLIDKNETMSMSEQHEFICDCLPACDVHHYTNVIETAPLDRNFTLIQKRYFRGITGIGDLAFLHMFYEDLISERYRLDVTENWLTFMGTFGGIAGLYMGYSIVSFFEIFFFTIIRPICNWFTKRQIKQSRKKQENKAKQ